MQGLVRYSVLFVLLTGLAANCRAQQTGVPTQRFRLVRSTSGSEGYEQNGRFIVKDPRDVFSLTEDKQVIVSCEWEGPPGYHKFEGHWKNPEGKTMAISEFKFNAPGRRFSGYWTLMLNETLLPGLWAMQAHIDGEPAGVHVFQIQPGPKPQATVPQRAPLSHSEMYRRVLDSSVFVEKLNSTGDRIGMASGFVIAKSLVLTLFRNVDGGSRLRLFLPDGRRVETSELATWNRWQDWALLQAAVGDLPALAVAADGSWAVGDRCFSVDVPSEGNRTIIDGNITGTNQHAAAGQRLNLNFGASSQAAGSPLLNEYGEVIGVVGAGTVPGAYDVMHQSSLMFFRSNFEYGAAMQRGMLALPISLVKIPGEKLRAATLAELAQNGELTVPVVQHQNISRGSLAKDVQKSGYSPVPNLVGEGYEFSRNDGKVVVFILWEPKEKRKAMSTLRTYDLNNRILSESKPSKITLNPGRSMFSTWEMKIGMLPPGIYRVDVMLDSDAVWRTFFRITEEPRRQSYSQSSQRGVAL